MAADDAEGFAALLSGFDDADADDAEPLLAAMDDGEAEQDGPSQQQHEEPNDDWAALCAAAEDEDDDDAAGAGGSSGIEPPSEFESGFSSARPASASAAAKPTSFANMFAAEAVSQSFAASIKETMGNAPPASLAASARSAAAAAVPAASFTPRVATFNRSTPPAAQLPTPTPIATPAALSQRRSTSTADFGARPASAAPAAASSTYAPPEKDDTIRDSISGFKLSNRLVSSLVLKDKISGSLVLSLRDAAAKKKAQSTVTPFNQGGAPPAPGGALGILGNFVVFGVLTHKSLPKATSTGKGHFMLWTLSDLQGCAATVLLFGKAFQAYATRVPEGAVVAIANPEEGGKQGGGGGGSSGGGSWKGGGSASGSASALPSLCFALKHAGQVLHLGACADFGYCKSYRNEQGTHGGSQKSLARCKNVVNLSKGEYCEYHVKSEYKKIMSSRADLNQSRDRSHVAFSSGAAVPTSSAIAKRSNAIGSSIALRASMQPRGGISAAAAGRGPSSTPAAVPAANANDPFHWSLDGFREALGSNSAEERKSATAGMPALKLMALMEQDPDLMSPTLFTQAQRVQYKANADAARKKIAMQQAKQQRGTPATTPAVSYTAAELKAEAQRKILLAGGTLKGGCKAALKVPEAKTAPSEIAAGAARWDALSDRSKSSSRFVQRVVATQLGSVGAPMLTTKDMGMMSAVDKISQGIKQEATSQGKEAAKLNEAQLAAAAQKAAAAKAASAASQSTSRPSTAPLATSATALANFSYTSKHPQQQSSLAAALANKTQTVTATAAAAPSTQRSAAHVPAASSASARPSATLSAAAPKQTTQPTPRPASAAPSATPAPSPPRPAVPSGTFIQSFGSAAPSASAASSASALGSGLVPMLGRGWSHSALSPSPTDRPLILNAMERAAAAKQAAQLARVAELRASGAIGKVDPNSTATAVRLPLRPLTNGAAAATAGAKRKQTGESDDPASAAKSHYSLNSNGSITLNRPASASAMVDDSSASAPVSASAAALASKRARLSDAFGFGSSAREMDRLLDASVGSKHSGLIVESASSVAAQEALFNLMEKRETLAVHLNSITSQSVKAYRCTHSGCNAQPSEFPLAACKSKGHRIERVDLQKRFFSCAGCKFHLTALGLRMPTHACHKCGGTIWTKAAMIPMKIDSSDRDQLQLRSEETWLRSTN